MWQMGVVFSVASHGSMSCSVSKHVYSVCRLPSAYRLLGLFTSLAKEVIFLVALVCLSVCLSVCL